MQEQTLPKEDTWQSPLCSKPEYMFMNDKQSRLVRGSTAQCNDLTKQMQARKSLTTSVDNCPSTSITGTCVYCTGDRSQFNRCNGSPFVKTHRTCHRSHTSSTRYLNKSSTINYNYSSLFTAFSASNSTGQAIGIKCPRSQATQEDKHHGSDVQSIPASFKLGRPKTLEGGPVGCQNTTAKK